MAQAVDLKHDNGTYQRHFNLPTCLFYYHRGFKKIVLVSSMDPMDTSSTNGPSHRLSQVHPLPESSSIIPTALKN